MAAKPRPNELHISRIFDAPVKRVWDAWVEPEQVAQWWGPRGFTLTSHHKDVKTGGSWQYVMHGPDGVDYPNYTKFLEVDPYARLVYDHGASDGDTAPMFRVTVTFEEVRGKTKMEMTMALANAEAAAETKKFIKKAGGDSTWDRLAEYVAPTERFVINRAFDASLERMFAMWIEPEHLAKWLPPTGFTMAIQHADIRPGGHSIYSMSNGQGLTMHGRIDYLEIDRPTRIVSTQQFTDEHGQVARHPASPTFPATLLRTVTFTPEDTDRTRVTVVWEIFGEVTAAERETFLRERAGMTKGWTGSFDKLEEQLTIA